MFALFISMMLEMNVFVLLMKNHVQDIQVMNGTIGLMADRSPHGAYANAGKNEKDNKSTMSRTYKKHKDPGYEYWGRRYGNDKGLAPSSDNKRRTNRAERRIRKQSIGKEKTE